MRKSQIGAVVVGIVSLTLLGLQGCQQSSSTPANNNETIHQGGPGTGGSGSGTNTGDSGTNNGGPAGITK